MFYYQSNLTLFHQVLLRDLEICLLDSITEKRGYDILSRSRLIIYSIISDFAWARFVGGV